MWEENYTNIQLYHQTNYITNVLDKMHSITSSKENREGNKTSYLGKLWARYNNEKKQTEFIHNTLLVNKWVSCRGIGTAEIESVLYVN